MYRLAIPYVLLGLVVFFYLYYRKSKTGPVILKVRRILFSRVNLDSFITIGLLALVCGFFIRYDLINYAEHTTPAKTAYLNNIVFYCLLFLTFLVKQIENPAIREYGISSARGFWRWEQVTSYRWEKSDVLTFKITGRKKYKAESWHVTPKQKKELTAALKKRIK